MNDPAIFISFREPDTQFFAAQLATELRFRFGASSTFLSTTSISPGEPWPDAIQTAVRECRVVIALIGKAWLTEQDRYGRRRLDSDEDWVRLEIEAGLEVQGRVAPVLVDGAMPIPREALHEHPRLRALTELQAAQLRPLDWDGDLAKIFAHVEGTGIPVIGLPPLRHARMFCGNIPEHGAGQFIGRGADLDLIRERLPDPTRGGVLVLQGQPGVGKTELAYEYARRERALYPGGTYVLNFTEGALHQQMATIGLTFLDVTEGESVEATARAAFLAFGKQSTLMICDDVPHSDVLTKYRPLSGMPCHTLVTSTNAFWDPAHEAIEVYPLEEGDAHDLVAGIAGADLAALHGAEIVDFAGGLPMQLCQTAAQLRRARAQGVDESFAVSSQESFWDTRGSSLDRYDVDAQVVLHACLLYSRAQIPREDLISLLLENLPWTEERAREAIARCREDYLLQGDDPMHLHQLTRRLIQAHELDAPELRTVLDRLDDVLRARAEVGRAFTSDDPPLERPGLISKRAIDTCTLVVFGATGNRARAVVLPALASLLSAGALPQGFALVVVGRNLNDEVFTHGVLSELAPEEQRAFRSLSKAGRIRCVAIDYREAGASRALGRALREFEDFTGATTRVHYLCLPPGEYPRLAAVLGEERLRGGRLVLEKPHGFDLKSSSGLNDAIARAFPEEDVFRLDENLARETVQNIMTLRFSNGAIESFWNRRSVDHVQITVAESVGIEGRGHYFDEAGVTRDLIQGQVLHLLSLIAMEPPSSLSAPSVRSARLAVLQAVPSLELEQIATRSVRGQYDGYRSEPGVASLSKTETYAAVRLEVKNRRWAGVPFFVRAGKGLSERRTEVAVVLKRPSAGFIGDSGVLTQPNALVLSVHPDEGVSLAINTKVPGDEYSVGGVTMDFKYAEAFDKESSPPFERLLLDPMRGDSTLFRHRAEIDEAWRITDSITKGWEATQQEVHLYTRGSWGPKEAESLFGPGRTWEGRR